MSRKREKRLDQKLTPEAKAILLNLLQECFQEEIAHLELRIIRDSQAPRFAALKKSHPEIHRDFMKARKGPHEILLRVRRKRISVLTELIEA